MTKWRINGGTLTGGSVAVAGYKHALVPMITASICSSEPVEISNAPGVLDTVVLGQIIRHMGGEMEHQDGRVRIDAAGMRSMLVPDALSAQIHGSVYLIPALLARFGEVEFGPSGGCQIGDSAQGGKRPVQHMTSVLERFGARFEEEGEHLRGRCGTLRGTEIDIMDYSTDPKRRALEGPYMSGATKTAVLAAVNAEGTTVIHNPHDKEATLDLVRFLREAGCSIEAEERRFVIRGRSRLRAVSHRLISDTTEMVTLIALSVFTATPLTIENVTVEAVQRPLAPEIEVFNAMGVTLRWGADSIDVRAPERLAGVDIEATGLGVATDSQPFLTLMLTIADRPSRVTDTIWRHRFGYVDPLVRLGAELRVEGASVHVTPARPHRAGQSLRATDTRAAAVLALAALGIRGETVIADVHHAARGYERLVPKLRALGADISEIHA
ncbi:UDP-N-acetylglucosamine 1-carboxyvinyltransferase [Sorangium sp. So ce1151]|uniref:UDP-N-acetylglucosamine 1-carboxyvinyltransferase n=1 Tax=Sorangium sp. So ce1151 TaxID=3133332 RepID=UPI003F60EDFE